uniref:Putative secreted small salivary protein n=1 Tax=Xenopsylla cheopis TaxID=163159 RepID=A2IAA9_XENCH|nr:putative secreted small salivary protein [Xenopsylla cheopis]
MSFKLLLTLVVLALTAFVSVNAQKPGEEYDEAFAI